MTERYNGQLESVSPEMEKMMESMENALIPRSLYACAQIDTCQVESYFGPLVPILRT
jgi:hypothetical protein